MINRKAFFEIFFYNRETPSRELLETAESVWRAYMQKHGLGLDASNNGNPTYEEVKEITYLANYAIEMVAAREAAEAAPASNSAAEEYTEEYTEETVAAVEEEPAEETTAEVTEETTEEVAEEEVAEEIVEEPEEEIIEETQEAVIEEKPVKKEPAPTIPAEVKIAEKVLPSEKPASKSGASSDVILWVEQLIHWCEGKGLQCIKTVDDGDYYLHVYLPHRKEVHPVGKWVFQKDTNGADLAAEISKLYAYCTGFVDCFEQLMK